MAVSTTAATTRQESHAGGCEDDCHVLSACVSQVADKSWNVGMEGALEDVHQKERATGEGGGQIYVQEAESI